MKVHSLLLSSYISLLFLLGCAGYHTVDHRNPLFRYGVKSISIPMFVNQTSYSGVNAPFTREIARILHSYPDLQVYSGEKLQADAILIGVIKGEDKLVDGQESTTKRFTNDTLKDSIGNRKQFYLPSNTTYKLSLELTLIKDPTPLDYKLIQTDLKKYMSRHPKVIFNESLALNGSFDRVILGNTAPDDGGVVNYTQNKALFDKSIDTLAKNAAQNFKDVILNAF